MPEQTRLVTTRRTRYDTSLYSFDVSLEYGRSTVLQSGRSIFWDRGNKDSSRFLLHNASWYLIKYILNTTAASFQIIEHDNFEFGQKFPMVEIDRGSIWNRIVLPFGKKLRVDVVDFGWKWSLNWKLPIRMTPDFRLRCSRTRIFSCWFWRIAFLAEFQTEPQVTLWYMYFCYTITESINQTKACMSLIKFHMQ